MSYNVVLVLVEREHGLYVYIFVILALLEEHISITSFGL
jgi:hypothetical protein